MRQSLNKMKEKILSEHDKEEKKFKDTSKLYALEIAQALQQGFKYEKVSTNGTTWLSEYKKLYETKNYSSMYQHGFFDKIKFPSTKALI